MLERLLQTAPEFTLPATALDQTVGWSSEECRPISLREFIAARAPRRTRQAVGVSPREARGPVKRVTELTEEELIETVCTLLLEGRVDTKLATLDQGDFSREELVEQVKARTPLGQRLVVSAKRHLHLLEQLIESGKLRTVREEVSTVELPDFPY